ncbi:MAG: isochorismatase family protein [Gemmataceae bacterium]|nr:isochorismatase family protein [Gemmataceae bacterium]MCI0740508.1 isochorismatase family protein [Gemmataceae bacterium]
MPHPSQLLANESALLVIDVQEKLMFKIPGAAEQVRNIAFLIDVANLLGVPMSATEQYPKGLGPTVPELASRLPNRPDKLAFSSCAVPSVIEGFRAQKRSRIVLAGIETHVCVLNTALDLLAAGFRIYLPVDALGARGRLDHETALKRLAHEHATLTTVETCAFEWLGGASHPNFKLVSKLVQERMKALV